MRRYTVLAALAATVTALSAAAPAAAGAPAWHRPASARANARAAARTARVDTCAHARVCSADVTSVACPTVRACTAGGLYADGDGKLQAFVISEKNGRWGRAAEVPGTAPLNTGRHAAAWAVSCPSAGNCALSGTYTGAAGHVQVYVASEKNGRWGTARELAGSGALDATAASAGLLSCRSAGNCTAGGTYDAPDRSQESFVATESHGVWGPVGHIRGSQSFNASKLVDLEGLSCTSPGNCTAGGTYGPPGTVTSDAFVVSERNGRWGGPVVVAADLGGSRGAQVQDVACPSAGTCVATGSYTDVRGRLQGFVVSATDGRWAPARPIPGLQALNTGGDAEPEVVACASAGNCSAGGSFSRGYPPNQTEPVQAFVASEKNGRWGAAEEVPGSHAVNTGLDAVVTGMSCPAAGDCAATVTYTANGYQAGVVTQARGNWGRITKTRGWAGVHSFGNEQIAPISCASPGNCVAGGTFESAVGYQAFLVSERNGAWGDVWQVRGF